MKEAAANLKFEEAARLHDEIRRMEAVKIRVSRGGDTGKIWVSRG